MLVSHLLKACGLLCGIHSTEKPWPDVIIAPSNNSLGRRTNCVRKLSILQCTNRDDNNSDEDRITGETSDDDEDDEEEENNLPYKGRSLTWTNRYRKLIPYESARARAMSLGLRSKGEWDEYLEDGDCHEHGPYLPTRPDLMYPDDWVNWEEFLGIMRPYEEARDLVKTLGIQNFDEYERFVRANKKRAEGLRIPAKPHIVYKNTGWVSFEDFFGSFD